MTRATCPCPVCQGTGRRPAGAYAYKAITAGYDLETDTLPCGNCGGQTMGGQPTGRSFLRDDGTPCTHEYTTTNLGRCYRRYNCKHCGYSYSIDSGD